MRAFSHSSSAARRRRVALALALLASLLVAVGGVISSAATAASPAPVSVTLDSVKSDVTAPKGTPTGAVPTVLAEVGGTVHVQVSFYDATGAPASFTKSTSVIVTSGEGNPGGLTQQTTTVAKGATSATLDVTFSKGANGVMLTVTVPGKSGTSFSTTASADKGQVFDVAKLLDQYFQKAGTSLKQGIGGDSGCQNATVSNPVCGVLSLPNGAASEQVLLSLGVCDGIGNCGGSVVQALASLTGLYSKDNPASLLMKCDKTLCGGGRIEDHHVFYSHTATGALVAAPACLAKGTIDTSQDVCVDYVQSKRDLSGDTLLLLLFTQDMRGSVG